MRVIMRADYRSDKVGRVKNRARIPSGGYTKNRVLEKITSNNLFKIKSNFTKNIHKIQQDSS